MALRNFKVLTFDVVGTLIDFERGMLNYLRKVGGPAVAARSDDDILACYRQHRGNTPTQWFPDDLVRVYAAMTPDLGLPTGKELAEGFRNSIKDWPPFPEFDRGAAAAWRSLRACRHDQRPALGSELHAKDAALPLPRHRHGR